MAEVIDALLSISLLTNDGVYPKPVQNVFLVIIESAPPRVPLRRSSLHRRNSIGSVLQIAPGAARIVIKRSGNISQRIIKLFWCSDSSAPAEHISEIRGQAFIDP